MKAPGDTTLGVSERLGSITTPQPTVNLREADNTSEEAAAAGQRARGVTDSINFPKSKLTFSRHGTFHADRKTHPGIE